MSAQPTATGTLETTPMSQLVVYALDKRLTGSFVFQAPDGGRSALYVADGVPAKAKTAKPVIHLGRLLLELGTIDENTYNQTLARLAKEKRLHGQILLEAGALDQRALDLALSEQLTRQLVWFFSLSIRTAYGFYADTNFLEQYGGENVSIEPLVALWRGVRTAENAKRIDVTLARLGNHPLRMHPSAQVGRFRFAKADQPVVDILRAKPQTLRELMAAGVGDVGTVKRVVYVLMLTRHLDLGAPPIGVDRGPAAVGGTATVERSARRVERTKKPTGSGPAASPAGKPAKLPKPAAPVSSPKAAKAPAAAAGAASAGSEALHAELAELAERIPRQNYYEILGVPQDTPSAAISGAFFQLAKKWHPDRLPADLADVREMAVKMFSRMTEAHQTLTDAQRRGEYDQVLKEGGGTPEEQEQVQQVVQAIMTFQKAQVLFKKQNLVEAERLAKAAMDADPTQGEYVALWVQIEALKPERAANNNYADLIKKLNDVVKKEPENHQVRFARAEVLKRAGKLDEAAREYRWVAEHNPKNLEAIREVRLHSMRAGEKPPRGGKSAGAGSAKEGGLLGKLFKR